MSTESEHHNSGEPLPDRPIECSGCKKSISVKYTEIVNQHITSTSMCGDCPVLERRLNGAPVGEKAASPKEGATGLACGNCGTTMESIRMGSPLGCAHCYEVFTDVVIQELLSADKVPQRVASIKKTTPIHIGRAPGEAQEINPSLRLLALNEALSETLKREDYEQAAMLRDQIKELTDHQPEETDGEG